MKNRKWILVVSLVMALAMSLTGTLAYLTDTDEEVNVMTLGNVEIDQMENGESEGGFPEQPLYPAYVKDDGTVVGQLKKEVTVKNIGESSAYVRTWIAMEAGDLTVDNFDNVIHAGFGGTGYTKTEPQIGTIDGEKYYIVCVVYESALAKDETTPASLTYVYMDPSAGNDEIKAFGDKYEIKVLSQAVQTANFDGLTAAQALEEAFGAKDPWAAKIPNVGSSADLSEKIANGEQAVLGGKVQYNTPINKDASIDLNGNTFEAMGTINLGNNADLTMIGGDYEVNGTYGHIDVRPSSVEGSKVVFENVDFSYNKKGPTNGPSTNRLGSVVEVCATAANANTEILFKGCTFDNAQVLFEGLSGTVGTFEATFEDCTFNALTSSAPIYVQNYVKGTINIKNCTFNLEVTSSTASAVSISPSSSTSVELNIEDMTVNAKVATPTDSSVTGNDVVKVNGTPTGIKAISAYDNTTVNGTATLNWEN